MIDSMRLVVNILQMTKGQLIDTIEDLEVKSNNCTNKLIDERDDALGRAQALEEELKETESMLRDADRKAKYWQEQYVALFDFSQAGCRINKAGHLEGPDGAFKKAASISASYETGEYTPPIGRSQGLSELLPRDEKKISEIVNKFISKEDKEK